MAFLSLQHKLHMFCLWILCLSLFVWVTFDLGAVLPFCVRDPLDLLLGALCLAHSSCCLSVFLPFSVSVFLCFFDLPLVVFRLCLAHSSCCLSVFLPFCISLNYSWSYLGFSLLPPPDVDIIRFNITPMPYV